MLWRLRSQRVIIIIISIIKKTGLSKGATPVQRRRGRPRTSWFDNITAWVGLCLESVLGEAAERNKWRRGVYDEINPLIQNNYQEKTRHFQ